MLQIENATKKFGKREVVNGVSFQVNKGESFGLLGPNGAGKSTLIAMIGGLLSLDGGDIKISGVSVKKDSMAVRQKIGIVPQDIALYPSMSAQDNLMFWGKMYGLKARQAKERVGEVLAIIGLTERAKEKIATFSGGMKRRVNIGAALMHEPELLIMDEPTVGIDPQSRHHILETVKSLNQRGTTVIYTSHYMEEVEYLCERLAILDRGKVIVAGNKADLCERLAGEVVIQLKVDQAKEDYFMRLNDIKGVEKVVRQDEGFLQLFVTNSDVLGPVVSLSAASGVQLQAVEVRKPGLESLFLQLTGRSLRD
ncbi:ABC transporter ATP-binding protein [Bacillus xiapuensis]|uniref:ABC transporter ATP-binding protein n=1 Tax=Bacillus xiapuensis TaxID=2014075 RepID=UPI000C238A50|nr:ABC transporter ATP-binding protein [Bacillus xiapuensis]